MGDPSRKYHELSAAHTDPARIKREREKARELKKSRWWLDQVNRGICHHCGERFKAAELTMDHLIPLARGGTSAKGNIVCSCRSCNRDKKLEMPVDSLFEQLERERREREAAAAADAEVRPAPEQKSDRPAQVRPAPDQKPEDDDV